MTLRSATINNEEQIWWSLCCLQGTNTFFRASKINFPLAEQNFSFYLCSASTSTLTRDVSMTPLFQSHCFIQDVKGKLCCKIPSAPQRKREASAKAATASRDLSRGSMKRMRVTLPKGTRQGRKLCFCGTKDRHLREKRRRQNNFNQANLCYFLLRSHYKWNKGE